MASMTTAWLDEASRSKACEMELATDTGGDSEEAVVSKAGVNSCGLWRLQKRIVGNSLGNDAKYPFLCHL